MSYMTAFLYQEFLYDVIPLCRVYWHGSSVGVLYGLQICHELYDVIRFCTVHWSLSWVVWRRSFMCSSMACKGVLHGLQLCHELPYDVSPLSSVHWSSSWVVVWRHFFMYSSLACQGVLHDLHVYHELMYGHPSVPALLIAVAVEFTQQSSYSPHSEHRFPAPSSKLRASLSGTFLQTLPDLVTPLKGHSLSAQLYTEAVSALRKVWVLIKLEAG